MSHPSQIDDIFYLTIHLFTNHIRYGLVARICRSHAVPTRPGFNSPCRNHFFLPLHLILPISFCHPSPPFLLGLALSMPHRDAAESLLAGGTMAEVRGEGSQAACGTCGMRNRGLLPLFWRILMRRM
jgi:hypothetical protein